MIRSMVLIALLATSPAAWLAARAAPLDEAASVSESAAEVVAVRIHADWCGRCKALDAKLETSKAATGALPIRHLRLDYTRKDDAALTAALKAEGLHEAVLLAMGGKYVTGQLILIDAATGSLITSLTSDATEADLRAALVSAAG